MDLNKLAHDIHIANKHWWTDLYTGKPIQRNRQELLALVVSELAECLEGTRKDLMDDHLPHRKMAEVELADAKIRLLDYAGGYGIDLRDGLLDPRVLLPETKGAGIFQLMEAVCMCDRGDKYVIRAIRQIEDYAELWHYYLESAMQEKLEYNRTRGDHKNESRLAAGGKLF